MKRIKKSGWIAGLLLGMALLLPCSAFSAGIELPFFAIITAKPNVLLLLDNSLSMEWRVYDNQYPGPGESSRFQVMQRILTGTGRISCKDANQNQVYKGTPEGELSIYQDLANAGILRDEILLLRYSGGSYSIVDVATYQANLGSETFYFTFKTTADNTSRCCGNTTTTEGTYHFTRFLLENYGENAEFVENADITNDGITSYQRPIYMAGTSSSPSYLNNLLQFYAQADQFRVTRVKYRPSTTTTGCYKSGGTWQRCYYPVPFTSPLTAETVRTFVIWDQADYQNSLNPNYTDMVNSSLGIYDFVLYLQTPSAQGGGGWSTSYNRYTTTTRQTTRYCLRHSEIWLGDPVNPTCLTYRTLSNTYNLYIVSTSGTAVNVPSYWPITQTKYSDRINNAIPNVQEVDACDNPTNPAMPYLGDGRFGPEFILPSGSVKEWNQVRKGLGYSMISSWSSSCLNDPTWCGVFIDKYGSFTPLPYTAVIVDVPGIMDIYDLRYGLMIFDTSSGTDKDFPGVGGNLIFNLSEGSTANLWLQEIIANKDLNGDGVKADGTYPTVQPQTYTPIAGQLRDAFTYLYRRYFLTCPNDQPYCCQSCDYTITTPSQPTSLTGYAINPSPYNKWNWEEYGMENFNGHILLNDPYYYYQCRVNNIILLTDGGQSNGEPCLTSNCVYDVNTISERNTVIPVQQKYINYLKNPSEVIGNYSYSIPGQSSGAWPRTKVYVMGFALAGSSSSYDTYAVDMLTAMAAASDIPYPDPLFASPHPLSAMGKDDLTYPLFANSEVELLDAFNNVMKRIMAGNYARSAPAISANLKGGVAGNFDVGFTDEPLWLGHLYYGKIELGEGETAGEFEYIIDAADLLNARDSSTREIFTSLFNSSTRQWERVDFLPTNADGTIAGNPNQLASSLFIGYPSYSEYYDQNMDGVINATDAQMLIRFIRAENGVVYLDGDTNTANDIERVWKLGAIFHSTPISAGKWPLSGDITGELTMYQAFALDYQNDPEIIYVGALDGMLHAFFFDDPSTSWGDTHMEEAFAYIPNYVLPNLYHLRLGEQMVFVDGDPNVAVMMTHVGFPTTAPEGKSHYDTWCNPEEGWCLQAILFCGLRDGGASYFSLNVTDTNTVQGESGSNIKIRWEFTDPEDSDTTSIDPILGNTWSLAYIDELLYQPQDATTLDTRVAMIFGGGTSPTGRPYQGSWLYILDADTGTPIQTRLAPGSTPEIILVPSVDQRCDLAPGELITASNYSSKCDMSIPNYNQVAGDVLIVDANSDRNPDFGYFGDLQGRVWKLNIHDPDPAKWGICLFFDTGDRGYDDLMEPESECNGDLRDYTSTSQPSCVNPEKRRPVFYKPSALIAPGSAGLIVYIGTGHVEDRLEALDAIHRNYVFALLDNDTAGGCSYAEIWPGECEPGTRQVSCGWPIQLDIKEKLTSPPVAFEGEVFFQSWTPVGANPCEQGTTYEWEVEYSAGTGLISLEGQTELCRKKATAGFYGRPLVAGNTIVRFEGGKFKVKRKETEQFKGIYYWWVK